MVETQSGMKEKGEIVIFNPGSPFLDFPKCEKNKRENILHK
jgi:hypothetical protein